MGLVTCSTITESGMGHEYCSIYPPMEATALYRTTACQKSCIEAIVEAMWKRAVPHPQSSL